MFTNTGALLRRLSRSGKTKYARDREAPRDNGSRNSQRVSLASFSIVTCCLTFSLPHRVGTAGCTRVITNFAIRALAHPRVQREINENCSSLSSSPLIRPFSCQIATPSFCESRYFAALLCTSAAIILLAEDQILRIAYAIYVHIRVNRMRK